MSITPEEKSFFNISTKLMILLVIIGTLTSSVLGFFYYRATIKKVEKELGLRLEYMARSASLSISISDHQVILDAYLSQESKIEEKPAFKRLQQQLKKIKDANNLTSDIYTLIKPDWVEGQMVYIAMSNENSYIGNGSPITPVAKLFFESKKAIHSGLYKDEEGHWISGIAPLINSNGDLVAALEIDYHADKEVAASKRESLNLILKLILLTILFSSLIGLFLGHLFSRPIRTLTNMARKLSKGERDVENLITSRDEIGILANTFNRLAIDLKQKESEIQHYISNLESLVQERTINLETEKNFSENIIQSMQDMLLVIDSHGEILISNKIAQERLKLSHQKGRRNNIQDLIPLEQIRDCNFEHDNYFETVIKTNSVEIPVLMTKSYINGIDESEGIVFSLKDLSKRKQAEQEIEEQRALVAQSSRLASLGEMASGIAHEINNPVTIIEGQLRRLGDYIDDVDITDCETFELLGKIQKNLNRVVKIVNGLRKISRKSDNDSFESLNLKDVVSEMMNLCSEKYHNSSIEIDVQDISEEAFISARESEVIQVLMNLIGNAHDAIADEEGEKWITLKEVINPDHIVLKVQDSGNGIPEENLKKLFQPFFTTKDIGKGTGIGLSISKKIMQEHGGDLLYDHESSHTAFLIKFPKAA